MESLNKIFVESNCFAILKGKVELIKKCIDKKGENFVILELNTINGNRKEWHRVAIFDEYYMNFAILNIHQGDLLLVIGELQYHSYKTRSGFILKKTDIVINNNEITTIKILKSFENNSIDIGNEL